MSFTGRTRRLAIGIVTTALLATTVAGAALAVGSVRTYTGCLTVSGGTLTLIKEGSAPQKPCGPGSVVARFSEGDITSITASTGLRGGAESGDVTLDVAPTYRLPQGCAIGKIAKWDGSLWQCADDANSTYTNGTGLDLAGNQFSIDEPYRLPAADEGDSIIKGAGDTWTTEQFTRAGESCPSGQFVRGTASGGGVTCAAPVAGTGQYVSGSGPDAGIPDDDVSRAYATLAPGSGTYFIVAKAVIQSQQSVTQFRGVTCAIRVDGSVVDRIKLTDDTLEGVADIPIALTGAAPVSNEFALTCTANEGADGLSIVDIKLVGVKL